MLPFLRHGTPNLHQNGVNLNARNDEPICLACQAGHLDIVRYLHQNGIRLNLGWNEPLLRACAGGHLNVVRYLNQNGVSLTVPDNEPLCHAAAAGHVELVRFIHQNGGDIHARGNDPLRRAAAGEHLAVVRYLHDAGAATDLLTVEALQSIEEMRQELRAAPAVDQPSAFWKEISQDIVNSVRERNSILVAIAADSGSTFSLRSLARAMAVSAICC